MTDSTSVTQVAHPWKATLRTLVAVIIAAAAVVPTLGVIWPTLPAVAVAVAVAGIITRIMALSSVENFLSKYVPFLSAGAVGPEEKKVLDFLEQILDIVKDVQPLIKKDTPQS